MNKNDFVKIFFKVNKNFSWIQFVQKFKLINISNKDILLDYLFNNKMINLNLYKKNSFFQFIEKNPFEKNYFKEFIEKKSLKLINVSYALKNFKNNLLTKFKLKTYSSAINKHDPVIFFGLYNVNDLNTILNHKGEKYIMFGGSDLDFIFLNYLINKFDLEKIKFISISKNIFDRLLKKNIFSYLIYFNLVNNKIFYPIEYKYKDSIYIYNGYKKGLEFRYGEKIYKKIIKRLPHFNYIFSNELQLNNSDMPNIYKKCFIGLRLTLKDGNANTVQEFEAMKIPIIHNQSKYGIKWNKIDDIIDNINLYYKKNGYSGKKIIEYFSTSVEFQNLFEKYYEVKKNTDKNSKNLLLIWNGDHNNKLYEYRKKNSLPVMIIERGPLPNTIYIDNDSIFKSNINKNSYKINKNIDDHIKKLKQRNNSLESQNNKKFQFDKNNFEEVIFIPLQMRNDTSITKYSDWIKSKKNFIINIINLKKQFPNKLFLIKNHPREINKNLYKLECNNLIFTDQYNFMDILEICDKVLTINSSIGLYSMIFEKPCGIIGMSFYQIDGVNTKLNNHTDIYRFIDKSPYKINTKLSKEYLSYLCFDYLYNAKQIKDKSTNFKTKFLTNDLIIREKEKVYIKHTNPFFESLKKNYNIVKKSKEILMNSKLKVFLWSPLRNKKSDDYKIWNYRKRNILPVYSLERGALPNSLIIDNSNWLLSSLYYNEFFWNKELNNNQKKFIEEYFRNFIKSNDSLEIQGNFDISKLYILKKYKKAISIFLQLDNDQVIINGIDWMKSNILFKEYIIELSKKHQDILFMVKNHPLSKGKITKTTYFSYESKNLILVDNYNYKDIIKESEKVLIINSSVGLQSMIFGKECGIIGRSFYNIKNVNTKLNNKNDIDVFLKRDPIKVDKELSERFIYYLVNKFYVNCRMEKKKENLYENTCDIVFINDNKIHIDNRDTILIFGEVDIYREKENYGSHARIESLIKVLEINFNVKYILKKKSINFHYYGSLINDINPKFLIIEYIKMSPILNYINNKITTIIDTHDIMANRTKSFKKYNIEIHSYLNYDLNNEIKILKKFNYIICIQDDDNKYLKNYINSNKIITVKHFVNNSINFLHKINNELKNIFFYGSTSEHNLFSIESFINNCWIKYELYKKFNLNIYGTVCKTNIRNLFSDKYNITFFGEIKDLKKIYHTNDLLINPCLIGSGLKIKNVEALSVGCPLITSSIGIQGLHEFNKKDFVFVTDSYLDYPKIIDYIMDYDRRINIQKNILNLYKESFSIRNIYKDLYKVLYN